VSVGAGGGVVLVGGGVQSQLERGYMLSVGGVLLGCAVSWSGCAVGWRGVWCTKCQILATHVVSTRTPPYVC
jgi:hypothetical protein